MAAGPATFGNDVLDDPGLAGRALVSDPASSSETPSERWQRLKSRHRAEVDAATAARPSSQVPGSTLPVPEDFDAAWSTMQPAAAAPFPELSDAPPWVVASPALPVAEADPIPNTTAAPVLAAAPSSSAPWRPTHPVTEAMPLPERFDPFAPQPPVDVTPRPESSIIAAAGRRQDVPPLPMPLPGDMPGGSSGPRRSVRPIDEITPFYDTSVDRDIREYADQRASEYNVKFGGEEFQPRMFADVAMPWEPTNFWHFPLYFEDPALERYGHTRPFLIQPFVSGGRFMGQLIALPYQMTIDPVTKPIYALGWYRPGECAPKLKYQIPFNAQAAAVQAGVVTGLFFLIP